jgi:putative transcriptional regulator
MDYASGALPEPVALLVATHASLCRDCQGEIARLEALGGALFDALDAAPLEEGALDRTLLRLEDPASDKVVAETGDPRVPRPLRGYLAKNLDELAWKSRGSGSIAEVDLLAGHPGIRTRLLRIRGGTAVPRHSHEGNELTLVLAGGFSDASGHYLKGDVAVADASVDHRPVADAGADCLCLAVADAPLRLSGRFGRYLNAFLRL